MSQSTPNSPANRPRVTERSARSQPRLGPYSRIIDRGAVGGAIDGRSREGRFLLAYEQMLRDHVGGKPSIVQRQIINRAARLALHLELMDERSLSGGHAFTQHDNNFYIAWSNALGRLLSRLGLEATSTKAQPSLAELIRARASAQAGAR